MTCLVLMGPTTALPRAWTSLGRDDVSAMALVLHLQEGETKALPNPMAEAR